MAYDTAVVAETIASARYTMMVEAGLAMAGDGMHPPFIDNDADDNGGRLDNDFGYKDYLALECVGNQPGGKTFATSICPGGHVGQK
jgi:hypothetical protein